jgi:hypothetical protein
MLVLWLLFGFLINLTLIIFTWLGSSLIILGDLSTYSIKSIVNNQPSLAWFILGMCVGFTIGLIHALKLTKQNSYVSKAYKIAIIVIITAFLAGAISARFNPPTELFLKVLPQYTPDNHSAMWHKAFSTKWEFRDSYYQQVKENNHSVFIWGNHNNILGDFDFSANVTKYGGADDIGFGLIAKYNKLSPNNENFYYLLITGNGQFVMGKYSTKQKTSYNRIWQKSTAIKQGNNLNRLRIVCYKQKVIGWINEQRVAIFEDSTYTSSGRIGVMPAQGSGDAVAVYFDNFVVKIQPK